MKGYFCYPCDKDFTWRTLSEYRASLQAQKPSAEKRKPGPHRPQFNGIGASFASSGSCYLRTSDNSPRLSLPVQTTLSNPKRAIWAGLPLQPLNVRA